MLVSFGIQKTELGFIHFSNVLMNIIEIKIVIRLIKFSSLDIYIWAIKLITDVTIL